MLTSIRGTYNPHTHLSCLVGRVTGGDYPPVTRPTAELESLRAGWHLVFARDLDNYVSEYGDLLADQLDRLKIADAPSSSLEGDLTLARNIRYWTNQQPSSKIVMALLRPEDQAFIMACELPEGNFSFRVKGISAYSTILTCSPKHPALAIQDPSWEMQLDQLTAVYLLKIFLDLGTSNLSKCYANPIFPSLLNIASGYWPWTANGMLPPYEEIDHDD